MATDEITRLHTFQYQTLGAEDLAAEQAYHRDMRRRHNLGPHTWGIVAGLTLLENPHLGDPLARDPFVQPGTAIDGFGREIIVLNPIPLDPLLFDAFVNIAHHEVWIAFESEPADRPAYGWQVCDVDQQYTRTRETYRVIIDPDPTKIHDAIMVDGSKLAAASTPLDESVPYQELPSDDNDPVWLVRLGTVQWDGVSRRFIAAAPGRLNEKRRYTGIYVSEVIAPAGQLTLRDRATPNPIPAANAGAAVEVQGSLQIDRLTTAMQDVYVPTGKLTFGAQTRQMIDLWTDPVNGPQYGIGVQAGTLYFRTHNEFGWFQDGIHTNNSVDPGPGGKLQLRLNNGGLFFGSDRKQMLNLWGSQYGIGVQDWTMYFRSDSDFCWYKKGGHANGQSDPGAGGSLMMRVNPNGLEVIGNAIVRKDFEVDGVQNLFKVFTQTIRVVNGFAEPATWSIGHAGQFDRIYTKYAILQGFSIFGDPSGPAGHNTSDGAIPQHVFVQIDPPSMGDANITTGRAYCSESNAFDEHDNQVMFTVVVLGKGWM